jgi:hypothetical protein
MAVKLRPESNGRGPGFVKSAAFGDSLPMGSMYRRRRFPPEIVSHSVWLGQRFTLGFRDL